MSHLEALLELAKAVAARAQMRARASIKAEILLNFFIILPSVFLVFTICSV